MRLQDQVDVDGAASSERRQLETLLSRLVEIGADLQERRDLGRIRAEVETVAAQCRSRLDDLTDTSVSR